MHLWRSTRVTSLVPEKPFIGVAAVVVAAVDPFLDDLKKLAIKDLNVGTSKSMISHKRKRKGISPFP